MISRISILLIVLGLLLTRCNDSKKEPSPGPDPGANNTTTTTTERTDPGTNSEAMGGAGLIGTWKLQLDAYDDNSNGLLDPEERAKATPNNTSYQFKPDGSCVIQGMFKGRYELKNENGKENVIVYRNKMEGEEDEPDPEKFRILSVSGNELVLLMQQGYNDNTIWIFKRV